MKLSFPDNLVERFVIEVRRDYWEEEAYWLAFQDYYGKTAPVFRRFYLDRVKNHRLEEHERVSEALTGMSPQIARSISKQVQAQTPIGRAREWSQNLKNIRMTDHTLYFSNPNLENASLERFLRYGLSQGAKTFCLMHEDRFEQAKRALRKEGVRKRVDRLSLIDLDSFMEKAIGGDLDGAKRDLEAQLEKAVNDGHREMVLAGYAAGELFGMGRIGLCVEVEAFWARMETLFPLAVYCPYPMPKQYPGYETLRKMASYHNWISDGVKVYPLNLVNTFQPTPSRKPYQKSI